MKLKKLSALLLAAALCLSLAACGAPAGEEKKPEAPAEGETVTLKVAASATPHAEILNQVKEDLAKEGVNLEVVEYNDYVIPNTSVEDGLNDVNFFQHGPYLADFNEKHGTHLVSVAAVHYEPFGIYPCKVASLDALPDGATIAVPNDGTNEGRALLLCQDNGLIKLREDVGLNATPNDIVENPKNLKFLELEAAMLPTVTTEVDLAAINGNFAIQAGFSSAKDAIALEESEIVTETYANLLVVKEGNEDNPAVQALVKAVCSDKVRQYILDTYSNNVLPVF